MSEKPCKECGTAPRIPRNSRCRECQKVYLKAWYAANREKQKAFKQQYYTKNKESIGRKSRDDTRRIRKEVIDAYGGKCVCCGEHRIEFLAIDHIHGNGKAEKIANKVRGSQFYRWLKKRGFPQEDYRLLCHNCNQSIGYYGYCPHERRKIDAGVSPVQELIRSIDGRVLPPVREGSPR